MFELGWFDAILDNKEDTNVQQESLKCTKKTSVLVKFATFICTNTDWTGP